MLLPIRMQGQLEGSESGARGAICFRETPSGSTATQRCLCAAIEVLGASIGITTLLLLGRRLIGYVLGTTALAQANRAQVDFGRVRPYLSRPCPPAGQW
jgi:hypothetical protein